MAYIDISVSPDPWRSLLRERLADSMRSAHTSGDTVSSPYDAATYAIEYLLTEEGDLLLQGLKLAERSRLIPGVIFAGKDSDD